MFSYWWNTSSEQKKDNVITALQILINNKASLSLAYILSRVNKDLKKVSTELFNIFYNIPYVPISCKLSGSQITLISVNRKYIQSHSRWFMALSIHNSVDIMYIETQNWNESRSVGCNNLHCPPHCSDTITMFDEIIFLDERVNIPESIKIGINSYIRDIELYSPLMPYIIFNVSPYDEIILLCIKDKTLVSEMFWALFGFTVISKRAEALLYNIKNNIPSELKENIISALNPLKCMYMIIENPEKNIVNAANIIRSLPKSYLVSGVIKNIKKIKAKNYMLELKIGAPYNIIYLALNNGAFNAYIITRCIELINSIDMLKENIIPTPHVILTDMDKGLMRLPKNTRSDIENAIKECRDISMFAKYVTVSYLFGITNKYTMACDTGFFSICYLNLYETDYIRLGEIIYKIGRGNKSFYHFCRAEYDRIRQYYDVVITYMQILNIQQNYVDSRFLPNINRETACNIYIEKLKRSESLYIGAWKILGY